MAEMPRLEGETGRERTMRAVCYVHLTRWLPLLLAREDRLSMAVGLELRVPYCGHRLVEYAFNIPWRMKTADGQEKSVLRAAVADLLPASVLQRRKSPFPIIQDPDYGWVLREQLAAVANDPGAPVTSLLDASLTARLLRTKGPIPVDGWGVRRNVELALQLDAWLRRYQVRLEL
jgi:asparagine synthase (glutamine-hydrolysing)